MTTFNAKKNEARRTKISTAKLLSSSALTAAGLLALAINPAFAEDALVVPEATAPEAPAAWTDFTPEVGNVTIETPTDTLTNITQNTALFVGTSANLDIPEGYHVNIDQASSNYLFVAKAAPDADPTYILGRLTADGRVIIIDRNGVFTGKDSVIDVAGIIATTGDISTDHLQNSQFGQYQITNITDGKIDLSGQVTVANAGLAAFVAPTVVNSGVINAKLGKVAFASGEVVTLDMYGDKLVEIAVAGNKADALLKNSGTINAEGGVVQLSAKQAKGIVDNIINVDGVIDASSATQVGGKIILSGGGSGKVAVSGKLNAKGKQGGDIEVTGQFVSAEDNAVIDASGLNGGGTIHFGGDYQGGGNTPTSEYAFIGQNAILNANSEEDGDGGEVVVWSDKATGFFGLITAKGGANSGNGGLVETSSKGTLQALGSVDASAANGIGGEWLLDPDHLTVIAPGADADITNVAGNPNIITASGGAPNSVVTNTTIENSLNAGTSVTLRTNDLGPASPGDGDIRVNAAITKTAGGDATLRLEAHDDIFITKDIVSNFGQLAVELIAGAFDALSSTTNNDVIIGDGVNSVSINTNGGNFLADSEDDVRVLSGGTINTAGGNVTLTADALSDDPDDGGFDVSINGLVNAAGGNIDINTIGAFFGLANSVQTTGTGTIEIDQNIGGSIQNAIDSVQNTGSGLNTVIVGPGTFNETVEIVENNFRLRSLNNFGINPNTGVRGAETIINGGIGSDGTAYSVKTTANNVTVDGFTLIADGNGVFLNGGANLNVKNNIISTSNNQDATDAGVYGLNTLNAAVQNNKITSTDNDGIKFVGGTVVNVLSNVIEATAGGFDGINFSGVANALIFGNTVHDTGDDGIVVDGGLNTTTIRGNKVYNVDTGIKATNTAGLVIDGSNIVYNTSEDGIYVGNSNSAQVFSNFIGYTDVSPTLTSGVANNIGGDGVQIVNSNNADIRYNTIINTSGNGIFVDPSLSAIVYNNIINNTGENGVYILESDYAQVLNNYIGTSGAPGNINGDGIRFYNSSAADVKENIVENTNQNGINIITGEDHHIQGNTISNVAFDGIHINDFGTAWIAYNTVSMTGDDGIEAANGDFVSIYNNYVFGAGFFADNADYYGADGIHVRNVEGLIIPPTEDEETSEGFGYSIADADSQIFGNNVAFTKDDGIEVIDGNRTYIFDNTLGHIGHETWNADGIHVENTDHIIIKQNRVADVLDDGIRVKNDHFYAPSYAGIFDNKVLLAGDEGIEVSGVDDFFEIFGADVDYPTYGWSVNIEDNEVALTGDNGIFVHNGGSTRIVNNDVLLAGLGEVVSDYVNEIADQVFGDNEEEFSISEWDWEGEEYANIQWSDGDGIKVENVHNYPEPIIFDEEPLVFLAGEGPVEYPVSEEEFAVLIQGNDVAWTGGDGIDVSWSGRTLIGGEEEGQGNTVYQAGIDWTETSGYYNFADLVSNGPFDDEDRRELWPEQDLTDLISDYIDFDYVDHDTHDGIVVNFVSNDFRPFATGFSNEETGYYGYAVNIIGNDVDTTGDDGIEVGYSSSVLIKDNDDITGAGVGLYDGTGIMSEEDKYNYGAGDYAGADGIVVHDVYGERLFYAAGSETYDGFTDYAVVIDHNTIDSTGDDGIEVYNSGRTLIARNVITRAGIFPYAYSMLSKDIEGWYGDGFGGDGIHVRNVLNGSIYSEGPYNSYNPEDWSVEIVENTIGALPEEMEDDYEDEYEDYKYYSNSVAGAADDGIQVLWSGNTLIDQNHIANIGIGGSSYYYGETDEWGEDGIHVLNGFIDEGIPSRKVKIAYSEDWDYNPYYFLSTTVDITHNTVDIVEDDGIEVQGVTDLLIDNNQVSDVGDNGINILAFEGFGEYEDDIFFDERPILVGIIEDVPEFNSVVTNNIVQNSDRNGLYVEGYGHNNVTFQGNDFIDNGGIYNYDEGFYIHGADARFESGHIDMSDLSNPNTFTHTDSEGTPLGMQFELAGEEDPTILTIVNETLGGSVFNGFENPGSFYVRFEDGAILDADGNVIVIDGSNSTFDGINPAAISSFNSSSQREFIESRLWDADDEFVNGRGQIFIGFSGFDLDESKFFNNFDGFNGDVSGLNVTITGLPSVNGGAGGAGGIGGTGGLNDIEPAAGDDEEGNPANIEPAAGGEGSQEAACWADAVTAAGGGVPVNYSYGGTFEESIASAANCSEPESF
ncbi:MAG: right-handed parallel beta-helix repeat-containing protein [Alphaproteobacteria bacterium]